MVLQLGSSASGIDLMIFYIALLQYNIVGLLTTVYYTGISYHVSCIHFLFAFDIYYSGL